MNIANKKKVKLLVDTGAEVSVISRHVLKPNTPITNKVIRLQGLYGGSDLTAGSCVGIFEIGPGIECEFNISNNSIALPFDGILGRNFLWNKVNILTIDRVLHFPISNITPIEINVPFLINKNKGNMCSTNTLKDSVPKQEPLNSGIVASPPTLDIIPCNSVPKGPKIPTPPQIILSHHQEPLSTNQRKKPVLTNTNNLCSTALKIPPRTEMVLEIPAGHCKGQVLCHAQEILPGVYTANGIVEPKMGKIALSIINTQEREIKLPAFEPQTEPLNNFLIYKLDKNRTYDKQLLTHNRIIKLQEEIKMDETHNPEERQAVIDLCREYHDIFHLEGDKLPFSDVISHTIPLKQDQTPINQRPYRLPEVYKEEINKQVNKMLEDNIVVPSSSPWNSPLLVVPKKSGPGGEKRWRIVIDFRKLNEKTIGDAFPLPRVEDILDQLGNSRYFSTLDLASGYHQIAMDPSDRKKTAFSTSFGHYEFLRMPFGLKTAPATFQRAMNRALTGLQGIKCFVYLDDIVVYGKNLDDHLSKLREVFDRLRKYNLKLQSSKCQFLRKEVVYLGHKCSREGCSPDPEKVKCVQNFPAPKTIKQLQSFLGLANYYRKFIPEFSKIAEPLTKLLRGKTRRFNWDQIADRAFQLLKDALTTPPLLAYPDFKQSFNLTTDASNEALGAVLSQGSPGKDRPIAYASRTLNKTERRYSTIEKELLAIVWAVKNFRCYLLGKRFTVYTDHQPLKGVFNVKDPTSRLIRFHHKLSEYDYEIQYKPGRKNGNADALSRIPIENSEILVTTRAQARSKEAANIDVEDEFPDNDEVLENEGAYNIQELTKENSPAGNKNYEYIHRPKDVKEILKAFHLNPLGGHQGIAKTYYRVRKQYRWKKMLKDIVQFIKNCPKCQKNKTGPQTRMPMIITDTPERPFDKVYLDIVGPLPITNKGNKYILTFEDDLTRFMDCYALPDCEASTVAKVFYEEIITRYRIPKVLLTDQGSNFMSELFKRVCKFLRINKINTSAYHPQSNGSLERAHRPLAEYLRNFVEDNPQSWDEWLREAVHVHNNTKHASTRLTPMDCLFGFTAELPSNLKQKPMPIYNHENYFYILRHKIQQAHEFARKNLIASKERSKKYYDRNTKEETFKVGDLVLLKNENKKGKLSPLWVGPYEVKQITSPVNLKIQIGKKVKTIHANRIKKFNVQ